MKIISNAGKSLGEWYSPFSGAVAVCWISYHIFWTSRPPFSYFNKIVQKRWIRVDEHFYLLAWIWSKFCMRHCLRAKNANDTVVDIDIDSSIEDIRQWDTKLPIHSPCQKTQPCLSMDPHMFKSFKKEKETNRNTSPNKQKSMPSLTSSPRRAIFVREFQKKQGVKY